MWDLGPPPESEEGLTRPTPQAEWRSAVFVSSERLWPWQFALALSIGTNAGFMTLTAAQFWLLTHPLAGH